MGWVRTIIAAMLFAGLLALGPEAAAQDAGGVAGLLAEAGDADGSLGRRAIQLFLLITVLSLAPGLAIMVTCFPFMVIVLSMLRQALGLQQAPPNMMIVSLAIFLTYFVMEPVFTEAWATGVQPLMDNDITEMQAMERVAKPFQDFMQARVADGVVTTLLEAAPMRDATDPAAREAFSVLAPAFMLSEIERGFQIGFLIFLPFLIIDLIVASVLMAMGMMMVPPAVVALPFKIAFFVMANGWSSLAGALVRGYSG
ncbi:MAG: flagellar type III secretion system pore protein FliP [Pseudomonadota bacterium]